MSQETFQLRSASASTRLDDADHPPLIIEPQIFNQRGAFPLQYLSKPLANLG